jgi:transcriptional regulator with XRE-family HTH domain
MLLHKKEVLFLIFWERFYQMCVLRGTKPNPLAKELGISSGAVTRWKNAEDPPSGKTLMLLADRLDCSVDYLLGRTDDPHRSESSPLPSCRSSPMQADTAQQ